MVDRFNTVGFLLLLTVLAETGITKLELIDVGPWLVGLTVGRTVGLGRMPVGGWLGDPVPLRWSSGGVQPRGYTLRRPLLLSPLPPAGRTPHRDARSRQGP